MKTLRNVDLRDYHSFALSAIASLLFLIEEEDELPLAIALCAEHYILLGEGSNTVFLDNLSTPIIKLNLHHRNIISSSAEETIIRVGAGHNWHELVTWSVEKGLYGIENLALIPGSVGAAPVQNIGAYGAEVEQCIRSVRGYDMAHRRFRELLHADCHFGYRDSIFKKTLKNKFIITEVTFVLKGGLFQPNLSYHALSQYLLDQGTPTPSHQEVYDAVIAIRSSKLPDPKQLGNAGSFFKNPIVPHDKCQSLSALYPQIPSYETGTGHLQKISAAWLIEKCGWKGKAVGGVAVYHKHALVLVNLGHGATQDLISIIDQIQSSVLLEFGINLEPEVNMINGQE